MTIRERLKKNFIELIHINEIYPYEKQIISHIESKFRSFGVECKRDRFDNLIVKISGNGDPFLISTHMDIPEPIHNLKYFDEDNFIRSQGTGILGADPKSGLAILIEFVCDMASCDHRNHLPIEAVITRGEEAGLFGVKNLDYSMIQSKMGIILDEDGPVTQVVVKTPSLVRMDFEITGKPAHTREPENAINALQVACQSLNSISWGYSSEGVTWNVGLFQGGTAVNTIPGYVKLEAELRSYDYEKAYSEACRIESIFQETSARFGAKCAIRSETEFKGYSMNMNHPLIQRLTQAYSSMGLSPNYYSTYGGTDANVFHEHGIICVPIGSGYYNAHQYSEYINLDEMVQIYEFLKIFFM